MGSCGLYTASTSPVLYEKLPNYETDEQFEDEHFAAIADEINAAAFEEDVAQPVSYTHLLCMFGGSIS